MHYIILVNGKVPPDTRSIMRNAIKHKNNSNIFTLKKFKFGIVYVSLVLMLLTKLAKYHHGKVQFRHFFNFHATFARDKMQICPK